MICRRACMKTLLKSRCRLVLYHHDSFQGHSSTIFTTRILRPGRGLLSVSRLRRRQQINILITRPLLMMLLLFFIIFLIVLDTPRSHRSTAPKSNGSFKPAPRTRNSPLAAASGSNTIGIVGRCAANIMV